MAQFLIDYSHALTIAREVSTKRALSAQDPGQAIGSTLTRRDRSAFCWTAY